MLLCPPPGDLPNPGIKPEPSAAPALQVDSLPLAPPGKSHIHIYPLFFGLPSHSSLHCVLSSLPCAIQQVFISYLFYTKYQSVVSLEVILPEATLGKPPFVRSCMGQAGQDRGGRSGRFIVIGTDTQMKWTVRVGL